jgi:hypothetical protein
VNTGLLVFFFSGAFFFAAPALLTATHSASAMVNTFFITFLFLYY